MLGGIEGLDLHEEGAEELQARIAHLEGELRIALQQRDDARRDGQGEPLRSEGLREEFEEFRKKAETDLGEARKELEESNRYETTACHRIKRLPEGIEGLNIP